MRVSLELQEKIHIWTHVQYAEHIHQDVQVDLDKDIQRILCSVRYTAIGEFILNY